MSAVEEQHDPVREYAAGLRTAVAPFLAGGGTQRELARGLTVAPATLSRYLGGERVASRAVLDALLGFLRERDRTVDEEAAARLRELCQRAHRSSGSPGVRLTEARGELAALREEHRRALRAAEEACARLTGERDAALARARRAEEAVELHQAHVLEQDKQLRHSQEENGRNAVELAGERERSEDRRKETAALRAQVRSLEGEVSTLRGENGPPPGKQYRTAVGNSARHGGPFVMVEGVPESGNGPATPPVAETTGGPGNGGFAWGPGGRPSDLVLALRLLRGRDLDGERRSESTVLRDGLAVAVHLAQIWLLGATLSACLRAQDRPSEWVLLLFASLGFCYALLCGAWAYRRADSYPGTGIRAPNTLVTLAVCTAIPGGVAVPALLDLDVPGRWLAEAVGLL
ncbi:hypothetical protein ABT160_35750 [Streptomyces sp. NPDC001941]|uniref:helix-turn-helix domain-containing protein n=1 Tax=Streptomyces sp. NPDC001941 TaxID=3154659 RepID=UPI00331E339A